MANLLDKKKYRAEYDKRYREANKDRISLRMKKYYVTLTEEQKQQRISYRKMNAEKNKIYAREYRKNNKDKVRKTIRDWYILNKDRKSKKAQEWKESNRGKVNSIATKRRAVKIRATPLWADLKAIEQFYINCPIGYHVDNIVPLQGVNICGLHVLNNLQYLPAEENMSKGNRYELA